MIVLLALLLWTAAPLHGLALDWCGAWAPDPSVALAVLALAALRPAALPAAALALGWMRAIVLVEPAGAQVLAALVALQVARGLIGLPTRRTAFSAAAVVAVAWSAVLFLIDTWIASSARAGGSTVDLARPLLLGALLLLPFSLARAWARRRARRAVLAP